MFRQQLLALRAARRYRPDKSRGDLRGGREKFGVCNLIAHKIYLVLEKVPRLSHAASGHLAKGGSSAAPRKQTRRCRFESPEALGTTRPFV
jgi:hypothetical protein